MERPFESLDRQVFIILPLRPCTELVVWVFCGSFLPTPGIGLITIAPAFLLYY